MKELIKYELYKLLHRPLVYASILGVLLMAGMMLVNWVAPGVNVVQEDRNGEWVMFEGSEAISRSKEIAARYQGPLTTEKVQSILETYGFSQAMMASRSMDSQRQAYYTHNFLYNIFSGDGFASSDGSYNGTAVEEIYGEIAPDLIIGYSDGWESTTYAIIYTFLVWCCVLVIILSPVFSEEYTRGTASLILTGIRGRSKCPLAKIIASFLIALVGSLLLIGCFVLTFLLYYGPEGFQSSAQLSPLGILSATPYVISWGAAFGYGCLLWLTAAFVVTAVTLIVSALSKGSFPSLVISSVLFVVPMVLPSITRDTPLYLPCCLMPINQLQLSGLFSLKPLSVGGAELPVMWLAVPVTIAAVAAGTFCSKRTFAHHQVV